MVAGFGDVQDGRRDGGLSGGMGERTRAAFESREALLEDVRRRVHDAGVDITELLQAEEIRGMFRIAELVARGPLSTVRLFQGRAALSLLAKPTTNFCAIVRWRA